VIEPGAPRSATTRDSAKATFCPVSEQSAKSSRH
jgi:hypothetical protein